MRRIFRGPARLEGRIEVPGDKSISHRALILNAIATGSAVVHNFPSSRDCLCTLECLRALGVSIRLERGSVDITGGGDSGLDEPDDVLDAGNSATCLRLLAGVLAGQPFLTVITGDRSLRSRPMGRIVRPLETMGARIWGRRGDAKAPLAIRGGDLHGIEYETPVASAQVKSSVLLAGLYAQGETRVVEPAKSRDHTERMLRGMGASVVTDARTVAVMPGRLRATDISIPGDISSAAFWMVAAAAHPNARILLPNVGVNPTRTGVLDVLGSMGADVRTSNERESGGEPVADIEVRSSQLKGTEIGGDMVPRMIDEIPVLALAGALANGRTVIRDAGELRVKESDRLQTTAAVLARLGAKVRERPDGLEIEGGAELEGCKCSSYGDHRIAMMLGVAALLSQGVTTIDRAEAADVSYSGFWQDMEWLAAGSEGEAGK